MAKYYVTSGENRQIIAAGTPAEAAEKLLAIVQQKQHRRPQRFLLATTIRISEKGFEEERPDDVVLPTEPLIIEFFRRGNLSGGLSVSL